MNARISGWITILAGVLLVFAAGAYLRDTAKPYTIAKILWPYGTYIVAIGIIVVLVGVVIVVTNRRK
ncbi:MAG: hypothetical protein ABSE39_12875 [Candidatus Bathyarchaeia archaeon]